MQRSLLRCRSALILMMPIVPKLCIRLTWKKKKFWVNRRSRIQKCYYFYHISLICAYLHILHAFTLIATVPRVYYIPTVPNTTHRPCITYSTMFYKITPAPLLVNFRFAAVNELWWVLRSEINHMGENPFLSAHLCDLACSQTSTLTFFLVRFLFFPKIFPKSIFLWLVWQNSKFERMDVRMTFEMPKNGHQTAYFRLKSR